MSAEFQECLKNGRIKKFSRGRALVGKELGTAEQDLTDARDSFKLKKYKWSTIQAYYSMFHSARALLYARDYREKSHCCLIVGYYVHYRLNEKTIRRWKEMTVRPLEEKQTETKRKENKQDETRHYHYPTRSGDRLQRPAPGSV